jgi:hypothetical protein
MKMKKQLLLLFLLALLPLVANAGIEIDGIYYNLNSTEKTAEVTSNPYKYTGSVIIPATVVYQGVEYDVTNIGNQAFSFCSALTSISISNSLVSISNEAFYYCPSLTSINIPNSVTSIGQLVFRHCI